MSWRDSLTRVRMADGRNLIGASFRGVPFFVEEADRSGGRRAKVHEFPLRDDPYVEDLGRKSRVFRINGYVIGGDYAQQKNRLLSVLEDSSGPGELFHPYYGKRRGICTSLTVREKIADGGVAIFDIEFTETPNQNLTPTEEADLAGDVDAAADRAMAAIDAELQGEYNTNTSPAYAVASLADEIEQRANEVQALLSPIITATDELAKLNVEIKVLVGEASSLVRTPGTIVSRFTSVLGLLTETAEESPRKMFSAFRSIYALAAIVDAVGSTPTRIQERANQAALTAALRRIFAIEAARLLPSIEHETLEDATADRDAVVALLDEQLGLAGNDAYPALMDLRAAVVRAVPGDQVLARVLTVSRPVSLPSLLLSYQLYGTVDEEQDIIDRNMVQHPGFLPSSVKALSHA